MDNKDFSILRETYLKNNNVLHTLKNQVTHIEDILEQQLKQLKRNCYHPKREIEYIPTDDPHGPSYYYKCKLCLNYIERYQITE